MKVLLCLFPLLIYSVIISSNAQICDLPDPIKEEIHSYQKIVDAIVETVLRGNYSGRLYEEITDFVDTFGPRYTGTAALEASIDDVALKMKIAGLEVHTEEVTVDSWSRGIESARMVYPREQKLSILGLGFSPNTSDAGVTAQVLVVADFDELEARKAEVPGKIVLFNAEFVSYPESGIYRMTGPDKAGNLGAVGALVRSSTPFSISSPHTGITSFSNPANKIPSAAITLENADLIARLIAKGGKGGGDAGGGGADKKAAGGAAAPKGGDAKAAGGDKKGGGKKGGKK